MRLWSLHPSFLDTKGLVALWREALLAQNVLCGKTKGYRHHPQLQRFLACRVPQEAIATYLLNVHDEAERRGYKFDEKKIINKPLPLTINVTDGQMSFELGHLKEKLSRRDQNQLLTIENFSLRPHPLFSVVPGATETWERLP
jgi:hypothetical protein